MKVEVDRLSGLNEINDIELQTSRTRVQQLLDSVGRLNFSIVKLKESQKALRALELRFDSLKVKNNFLRYNNSLLADKYEKTRREIQDLRGKTNSLEQAEALVRQKNKELSKELKVKSYLQMENAEGAGFRLRAGRPLNTNKASTIEKLRGCVTVLGNPNERGNVKVIYFQFLGPNMSVIEDNATTVSVGGNTYSKRVEIVYLGKELSVCDAITVPEGSLEEGIYTLNVFEDERLLSSTEFQLK
jgi:FtsZ-binding cell division protein ZapB